ncbi:LysR family transcriptional regulator [Arthrobacter pascens]|uniref:LysR family transcriptional regulator n=1 Tax=Arthrobacter pascens TaxID=1677 RepID=UPI00196A53C9|nr:LysR family transcriptional regulator [Arthrobacter pascens]MBN3499706.1 LysR family transcriptional regulator [Arthrobacter pascens]
MLDLRRLRIFAAVSEVGSFTAAAQRMYMTQSAVSQQMSILEREVGVALFLRMPRGIRLTEAGQTLAAHAHRLFVEISSIEQEMRGFANGPQEIRLGTFPSAGTDLLPQALRSFMALHPNVRVLPSSLSGSDPVGLLRDGSIHLLLMFEYDFDPRPVDPALMNIHLTDDPLMVVLPKDHPLAGAERVELAALAGEPWVIRAHRPPHEDPHDTVFRIAGFEPDIVFRSDDYQSLLGLVAAGVGVSLVPRLSLTPRRDDIVVRPTTPRTFNRKIMIQTLPEAYRSGPLGDLVKALQRTAAEASAFTPEVR